MSPKELCGPDIGRHSRSWGGGARCIHRDVWPRLKCNLTRLALVVCQGRQRGFFARGSPTAPH